MNDIANRTVTIDGKEHALDSLSEKARTQLGNLKIVDDEIAKIEQQLRIYKTARAAYARALKDELDKAQSQAH